MATHITFTKQLGSASSNNIAASQSASAGTALVLNGSASNYLSTTSTAAVLPNNTVIPVSSVTGLVQGQVITDTTTAGTIVSGSVIKAIGTASVSIWPPVGGTGILSGDTIIFPGTATIDTATTANLAIGRRVVIAYTGTDTSFAIVGINSTGNLITDTAVGSSGSAQSNMDFVTVTSIVPVGGGLTGVTAGTNGVGSSPWLAWDYRQPTPMNIGIMVELVTGSATFTVQHTYDNPNGLNNGLTYPISFNDANINGASATAESSVSFPIIASRVLISSGTGEVRARFEQVGLG